jgi:hypothetical protein
MSFIFNCRNSILIVYIIIGIIPILSVCIYLQISLFSSHFANPIIISFHLYVVVFVTVHNAAPRLPCGDDSISCFIAICLSYPAYPRNIYWSIVGFKFCCRRTEDKKVTYRALGLRKREKLISSLF